MLQLTLSVFVHFSGQAWQRRTVFISNPMFPFVNVGYFRARTEVFPCNRYVALLRVLEDNESSEWRDCFEGDQAVIEAKSGKASFPLDLKL